MKTETHTPATSITALELELDALRDRFEALRDSEESWRISCNGQLYRADEAERDAKRWRRIAEELANAIAFATSDRNDHRMRDALAAYHDAKEGKSNA